MTRAIGTSAINCPSDMFSAFKENSVDTVEKKNADTEKASVSSPSQNISSKMMAHNFASTNMEESKYLAARKAGNDAAGIQANRQNAILNAGLASLGSINGGGYAMRHLNGIKTARRIAEEGQQAVTEQSQKNLEDIKKNIEHKAQEAIQVREDKSCTTIPATEQGQTPPLPEIDGTAPSPQTPAAVPSLHDNAGTASSSAGQSTQSIDMVV